MLKWAAKHGIGSIRFETRMDWNNGQVIIVAVHEANEVEALLGNLEDTMSMLVQGNSREIGIARDHFIKSNPNTINENSATDSELHHRVFLEAYNTAYAAKVLLSNMPISLKIQPSSDHKKKKNKSAATESKLLSLPFPEGTDIPAFMDSVFLRRDAPSSATTSNKKKRNDDDDSSSSSSDDEEHVEQKRKKSRRSGGKKK